MRSNLYFFQIKYSKVISPILGVLVVFAAVGCALPRPEFEDQKFVPRRDVVAASIVNEGLGYYRAGRMFDAESKFRQAEYLYPAAENIKSNLGLTLRNLGYFEEAIKIQEALIKENPKMIDYQVALAETFFRAGNLQAAYKNYQEALDRYVIVGDVVKASNVARSMATVYFETGDQDKALCYSSLSYALNGDQAGLLRHTKMLIALGQAKNALSLLEVWASQVPTAMSDPAFLKQMSLSEYGGGDINEAARYADLAVTLKPAGGELDIELGFLNYALQEKLNPGTTLKVEESEDEEARDKLMEEIESYKNINPQVSLYWPVPLIEDLIKLQNTPEDE